MSQSRETDEDTDMAISYASRAPAGHPQTLPSFREVRRPDHPGGLPVHNTNDSCSSSLHTSTMKSTPHITPRASHRNDLRPDMRWPIPVPCRVIQQTHPLKCPTTSTANIPHVQSGRWASPCLCGDRVLFCHPSGTCTRCPNAKDIPTAE